MSIPSWMLWGNRKISSNGGHAMNCLHKCRLGYVYVVVSPGNPVICQYYPFLITIVSITLPLISYRIKIQA